MFPDLFVFQMITTIQDLLIFIQDIKPPMQPNSDYESIKYGKFQMKNFSSYGGTTTEERKEAKTTTVLTRASSKVMVTFPPLVDPLKFQEEYQFQGNYEESLEKRWEPIKEFKLKQAELEDGEYTEILCQLVILGPFII